jgi:hypothetical protein
MRQLYYLLAAFNAIAFVATLNPWFVLGALGFYGAAWADRKITEIQDRVVRELSKTCQCPLCKANRITEEHGRD